jgi:hypothetical protein
VTVHRSQSAYSPHEGSDRPTVPGRPAGGLDRWLIPGAAVFLLLAVVFSALMLAHLLPIGQAPAAAGMPATGPAGGAGAPTAVAQPTGPSAAPSTAPSAAPSPPPARSPSPTPAADGLFVRSAASGLCLDVDGDPNGQGTPAAQEPCTGSTRQRWRLVPNGSGYALVDVASGLCLDVNNGSTDDGAVVQVWGCNGGQNQQWQLQPVGGNLALLVVAHSSKCLDVPAQTQTVPTHLQQWTCLNDLNQRWSDAAS